MNLTAFIANIHWLPVAVTTILSFALGAAWHQKFLFGKIWSKENKPTLERKMNIPLIFWGTALMHFIAFCGLSALVSNLGWINGTIVGLLVSLVWVLPSMTATYLFANRSLKLLLVDAGMYIVLFALAGGILGAW